jgi:type IV pilus assembly protein PilA
MPSLQRGFTLLELMMVIAIIAFLTAIALPRYQDYSIRAKISEAILALSGCRTSISEVYQIGLSTAPGADGWGCETVSGSATKYVSAISTTADGVVRATMQNIAAVVNGSVLTMAPLAAPDTVATFTPGSAQRLYGWRCGSTADGTSLSSRYLPASCRG